MPWVDGDRLNSTNLNAKMPSGFAISVTDEDYGAVGNGVTDDAVAIQAAFDAVPTGGGVVIFPGAKTYVSTDALTPKAGTVVELNGSTLKFTTTAAENNLLLRSGCVVQNGTVENAGSGWTGHGGNGCPIVVGDYGSGTGYSNIVLRNLTIVTAKSNGNGIFITGESFNILVENIKAATSSTMGRLVTVHWGGADAPTAGTYHPHDIVIRDIDCGDLTYNDIDAAPVTLSAVYNVTVENVKGGDVTYGRAMLVYAGDYGAQYAAADVQRAFMRGIVVRNYAIVSSFEGIRPALKNISGTVSIWSGDVVFEGVSVKGNAPTSATCIGVNLTNSDGVHFRHCVIDGFNKNIGFEGTVANASFRHCKSVNAYASGLGTGTTSTPNFMDVELAYCLFEDNNTQTTASRGDVTLNNAGRWDIIGNVFNSPLNTFGVRAISTSSQLRLFNNHVSTLTAGGTAYSLGASTDAAFAAGANNTAAVGITVHGGAHMPLDVKTIGSTDGSELVPAYAYSSETSLGLYRSAASINRQSYGWLAADFISSSTTAQSGATAKLANQGQLFFSVLSLTTNGGEFGFRSGNTVYRFFSDAVG